MANAAPGSGGDSEGCVIWLGHRYGRLITRDEALVLLKEYTHSEPQLQRALAVEAARQSVANELGLSVPAP